MSASVSGRLFPSHVVCLNRAAGFVFQQRLLAKAAPPKYSKEYLNLRKVQDVLARQKECVFVPRV
jgi:hypothetical protein